MPPEPTTLEVEVPTATEFLELRRSVSWPEVSPDVAGTSLDGALYTVCLRQRRQLVGLGRVVGDGVLYFYVSDVLVHPGARGQGLGDRLMEALMGYIEAHAVDGATVAVLALPGGEAFYERHGFTRCPNPVFGRGLAFLDPLHRIL